VTESTPEDDWTTFSRVELLFVVGDLLLVLLSPETVR
jgi:hypothetical protein